MSTNRRCIELRRFIEQALGHVLDDEKLARIDRSLCGSFSAPTSWPALVRFVTNGESHFFRERDVFELLRQSLACLDRPRPFRILSAGCAAGQELYSCAIVAREDFGASFSEEVELWGVDVNPEFLQRAREGRYRSWDLRGLEEERRRRWFAGDGQENFLLEEELRRSARFRECNLLEDFPDDMPERFDFIFLRNVLVHLSNRARRRLLETLTRHLAENGILALATCEAMGARPPGLVLQQEEDFFFFRHRRAESPSEGKRSSVVAASFPLPPASSTRTKTSSLRASAPEACPEEVSFVRTKSSSPARDGEPREALPAFPTVLEDCLAAYGRSSFAQVVDESRKLRARMDALSAEEEGALWTLEGASELARGNGDRARSCLGRATVLVPLSWVAHFQRAEALRENGQQREASVQYEQARRCLVGAAETPVDRFFLAGFSTDQLAEVCQRRARLCEDRDDDEPSVVSSGKGMVR